MSRVRELETALCGCVGKGSAYGRNYGDIYLFQPFSSSCLGSVNAVALPSLKMNICPLYTVPVLSVQQSRRPADLDCSSSDASNHRALSPLSILGFRVSLLISSSCSGVSLVVSCHAANPGSLALRVGTSSCAAAHLRTFGFVVANSMIFGYQVLVSCSLAFLVLVWHILDEDV